MTMVLAGTKVKLNVGQPFYNTVLYGVLVVALLCYFLSVLVKGTHREKAPSNKTPALTKGIDIDICTVGTSKQLIIRGT